MTIGESKNQCIYYNSWQTIMNKQIFCISVLLKVQRKGEKLFEKKNLKVPGRGVNVQDGGHNNERKIEKHILEGDVQFPKKH